MVYASDVESIQIIGNNIGGSDNDMGCSFLQIAEGIGLLSVDNIRIENNQIHGISSNTDNAFGIEYGYNVASSIRKSAKVNGNSIHHIRGKKAVVGAFMTLTTQKSSYFLNNEVYALRGIGYSNQAGAVMLTSGLAIYANELTTNIPNTDTGIVHINGNKIFALDHETPIRNYFYDIAGIAVSGYKFKLNNNMISLGLKTNGEPIDSLEAGCNGILVGAVKKAEIEHNSIYIGGVGYYGDAGISYPISTNANGKKDIFLSNNIIQMDRRSMEFTDIITYVSGVGASFNNVVSNNNIWYSSIDTNIALKLQLLRQFGGIDSLTIIANPKYINPSGDSASLNLHLQNINPADSAGTPSISSILVDFDNQIRNNFSPIDIGADAVSPCTGNNGYEVISIIPSAEVIEICASDSLVLSGTLVGSVSQLQWQKGLNNIAGANSLTYTVKDSGSYRLVGKIACGSIASKPVNILKGITAPIVKIERIVDGPYCDSASVPLKVRHYHFTQNSLQYKWYRNNVLMPSKITDIETIDSIRLGDLIKVEVINATSCDTITTIDQMAFYDISDNIRPKIAIISFKDSLYSLINKDTVKYKLSAFSYTIPQIIYTTTYNGTAPTFVGDSLIIFTNIPASFKFKLHNSVANASPCYFADTTQELTIYVSNSTVPKTYTFIGSGNWDDPTNWSNNEMPSIPLPFNGSVVINPSSGVCVLNISYLIGIAGHFTIMPGANLIIQGSLIHL